MDNGGDARTPHRTSPNRSRHPTQFLKQLCSECRVGPEQVLRPPAPLRTRGPGAPGTVQDLVQEDWWRRYPRLLFVLDGTSPTGVETRISALRAAARDV